MAQLATVNGRIGRIFNQSENRNTDKTTSMHDTHAQTGPRHSKTNNHHSSLTLTANQVNTENSEHNTHQQQKAMDDNNKNRQNTDKFTHYGRIKYRWGADDEMMKIINRRANSPETRELVERKIELTRPSHVQYQWHKNLESEIFLSRRPNDGDRKELKDRYTPTKKKNAETNILGANTARILAT